MRHRHNAHPCLPSAEADFYGAGEPMVGKIERRLSAILSADGVGYSRLLDYDNTGMPTRRIHQGGSRVSLFTGNK